MKLSFSIIHFPQLIFWCVLDVTASQAVICCSFWGACVWPQPWGAWRAWTWSLLPNRLRRDFPLPAEGPRVSYCCAWARGERAVSLALVKALAECRSSWAVGEFLCLAAIAVPCAGSSCLALGLGAVFFWSGQREQRHRVLSSAFNVPTGRRLREEPAEPALALGRIWETSSPAGAECPGQPHGLSPPPALGSPAPGSYCSLSEWVSCVWPRCFSLHSSSSKPLKWGGNSAVPR